MADHPFFETPPVEVVERSKYADALKALGYEVELKPHNIPVVGSDEEWQWSVTVIKPDTHEWMRNVIGIDSAIIRDHANVINDPLQTQFDAYCVALLQHINA